jgi:hypothetical protein
MIGSRYYPAPSIPAPSPAHLITKTLIVLVLLLFVPVLSPANPYDPLPIAPATNVIAQDTPNDGGQSLDIAWTLSTDDYPKGGSVTGYEILRADSPDGPFDKVGSVGAGEASYTDAGVHDGKPYYYKIVAIGLGQVIESAMAGPARSAPSWFNLQRVNMLIAVILACGLVLWFIFHAKQGKELFIRRIAGLSAVDEALGRATEMGRPVLFLPSGGLAAVSDIQTLAGLIILGQVAKKTAEFDTPLLVPVSDPLVMTLAREIVKTSYTDAGRPDAFKPDNIRYLTNEQFAYTAGVDGIMLRERPAANFMIGTFYAESLILAETGYSTGAIQIAGTAQISQLPFFVAACDYTLIGEEIYAASAYLSREPVLLGSLKGQDWGKAICILAIVAGVILETAALKAPMLHFFVNLFTSR